MSIPLKTKEIVKDGSPVYNYTGIQMLTTTKLWVDMLSQFPLARQFLPFDSADIINNSAQQIEIYLNNIAETFPVPAYMIKPLVNRAIWRIGIKNIGTGTIAASELKINFRRTPARG